jgi:hypothetical protein
MLHLSNNDIAEIIGCRTEYVRAVRQRTDQDGNSIWDVAGRKWRDRNREHCNAIRRARRSERRAEDRAS